MPGEALLDLRPHLVIVVIDASNLERNLYLAVQVLEMGLPAVIALNMIDAANGRGIQIDDRTPGRRAGGARRAHGRPPRPGN